MGTLTIHLVDSDSVINDVPLDAVQYWVDLQSKFLNVKGYTFTVEY